MRIMLGLILTFAAVSALAQSEDATHRADRERTEALNRNVAEGATRRDTANDAAVDRYRAALADYARRRAEWQRRLAACQAGNIDACN